MRDTPFPYIGGKLKLVDRIIDLFPPHNTYVEVFGGSAAVLLNKKHAPIQVFNDIDSDVVAFFRIIRGEAAVFNEFIHLLNNTPYSREEYYIFKERYLKKEWKSELEHAYIWYVLALMSFGGRHLGGYGYHVTGKYPATDRYTKRLSVLEPIRSIFMTVQVENDSFENIIDRYDYGDCLFYCDPPYLKDAQQCAITGYKNDMSYEDHKHLLEILMSVKGKVVLSGYDHELYNSCLSDWTKREYAVYTGLAGGRTRADRETGLSTSGRTEIVWLSPSCNVKTLQRRSAF